MAAAAVEEMIYAQVVSLSLSLFRLGLGFTTCFLVIFYENPLPLPQPAMKLTQRPRWRLLRELFLLRFSFPLPTSPQGKPTAEGPRFPIGTPVADDLNPEAFRQSRFHRLLLSVLIKSPSKDDHRRN